MEIRYVLHLTKPTKDRYKHKPNITQASCIMGIGVIQPSNTLYDVGASIMNIHKSYYVTLETKIKCEGLLYNMCHVSVHHSLKPTVVITTRDKSTNEKKKTK